MNSQAVFAKHTGMIILGGGIVKHHICNANLMVCGYVLHKSWRYCVLFLHDLFVDHIIQTLIFIEEWSRLCCVCEYWPGI